MIYFFYKIENLVNHKKYIGITSNPQVRKNRHFNYLRQNKHPNPLLQTGFNYYGEDNFIFEVIETNDFKSKEDAYLHEQFLIKTIGNYPDGYNCNIGGEVSGPRGLFNQTEVYEIIIAHERYPKSGTILAQIFDCARKTINNITSGTNYAYYYNDVKMMSLSQKDKIFDDFNKRTNFVELVKLKPQKQNRGNLSLEQIVVICYQEEFHYPQHKKQLLEDFNLSNYSVIQAIRNGKTYQPQVYQYNQMSYLEKFKYACHYAETYNRKPPELLENLTETISS